MQSVSSLLLNSPLAKPLNVFLFSVIAASEISSVHLCSDFWNSSAGAFVSGEIHLGGLDLCPAFGESCCLHFCHPTYLPTFPISATRKFDKTAFYIFIQVNGLKDVAQERAEGTVLDHTNTDCLLNLTLTVVSILWVWRLKQLLLSCTALV